MSVVRECIGLWDFADSGDRGKNILTSDGTPRLINSNNLITFGTGRKSSTTAAFLNNTGILSSDVSNLAYFFTALPSGTATGSAWSFSCWLYLTNSTTGTHLQSAMMMGRQSGSASGMWNTDLAYLLGQDGANSGRFALGTRQGSTFNVGTPSNANVLSSIIPLTNTWYHVVGIHDGKTKELYVNGVQQNATLQDDSLGVTQQFSALWIGRHAVTTNLGFIGYIEQPIAWNRRIEPAEISYLYNRGLGRSTTELLALPSGNLKPTVSTPVLTGHSLLPVAAWLFTEITGSTITEVINSKNASIVAGTNNVQRQFKYGDRHNKFINNCYATVAADTILHLSNATGFTWFAEMRTWVNNSWRGVLCMDAAAGSWIMISSAGFLTWTRAPGNDYVSTFQLRDNAWHTIAVTFVSGNLNLYADGQNVGSWTGVTLAATTSGYRFSSNTSSEHMQGDFNYIFRYNAALSGTQIYSLHSNPYQMFSGFESVPYTYNDINISVSECCTYTKIGDYEAVRGSAILPVVDRPSFHANPLYAVGNLSTGFFAAPVKLQNQPEIIRIVSPTMAANEIVIASPNTRRRSYFTFSF